MSVLIPAVVFVVVLAVAVGIFYGAVKRPEDSQRDDVLKRLRGQQGGTAAAKKRFSLLKSADDVTAVPFVDRLVRPFAKFTLPLTRTLEHAGMKMTVGALLLTCGIAAVVVFVVVAALTGYEWLAMLVAVAAFWVPIVVVRFKATQRIRIFEEQFPDSIDMVSRALRAGHAFTSALSMVADEVPPPVGTEFKRLYDEQNFGMPVADAMRDFANRIPLLDAKFFVTAVMTQRESGGNLSEILDNLSRVIRERFKVKRQIRVISAHGRLTGYILMSLPPALAVAFMVISDNHVEALTGDILGWYMIGGATTLQLIGSLIIKKLVNIEY